MLKLIPIALVALAAAGCSTLPGTNEVPVGYRTECIVRPNLFVLHPPNSVRSGCIDRTRGYTDPGAVEVNG